MAKAKVKNVEQVARSTIKNFKGKLRKNISRARKDEIENEIIATILSGRSPVAGQTWKPYSEKYADKYKGGDLVPVDMLRTGDMLDSLEVKQERGFDGLVIQFNSQIAVYHDILGAGRSKVIRRLLPREGEIFRQEIRRLIEKLFRESVSKSTR